jgi:raffinose/stachyose/melibiose transport system permease protein
MRTAYHFGSRGTRWVPAALLLPGLILYIVVSLGPSVATIFYSFTDASGLIGAPTHFVGLSNYHEFLLLGQNMRDNSQMLVRTLQFAFLVTVIQTSIGLGCALLLNMRMRASNFFRTVFFLPVMLGVTIVALMWTLFLYPLGGPAQKVLGLFNAHSEFLGGPPFQAFLWVIWVQIWANMGVTMIIFLGGLQTIPLELEEASRIDGANGWQTFRHVTFPLLTPSLNTNLILAIIGSLQAWQLLLIMKGVTNGTQVLSLIIYAIAFGRTVQNPTAVAMRQGYGAAASVVLFVLVLIIGMTAQYLMRRRERRVLG